MYQRADCCVDCRASYALRFMHVMMLTSPHCQANRFPILLPQQALPISATWRSCANTRCLLQCQSLVQLQASHRPSESRSRWVSRHGSMLQRLTWPLDLHPASHPVTPLKYPPPMCPRLCQRPLRTASWKHGPYPQRTRVRAWSCFALSSGVAMSFTLQQGCYWPSLLRVLSSRYASWFGSCVPSRQNMHGWHGIASQPHSTSMTASPPGPYRHGYQDWHVP